MQLIHLSTIICGFFCLFLVALTHTSTCLRHFAQRSYQQNVGIHGKNHSTIATTTSTFDFIPLCKQINTSMFEQFLDLLCWLFPPEIFGMMKKAKAAMTWREKLHQEFTLCAFLSKYRSSSNNFIVFFFTAGSYNTSNEGSRFCYLPSKRKWSFLDMSKGEAEEANASLLQKRCERKLVSPKWKQINVSVNPFSSQEDHLGSFSKRGRFLGESIPRE